MGGAGEKRFVMEEVIMQQKETDKYKCPLDGIITC